MLPALKTEVKRLLRILFGRFLQADTIQEAGANLTTLNYSDPKLQLPDEQLGIGHMTWAHLNDEEYYLDPRAKEIFFNGVKDFYKAVVSTMLKKFSFSDGVVDVAILMPENQASVDCAATLRLAKRFPAAVSQEAFDALEGEVLDYKLAPSSTMPSVCKESGKPTKSAELCTYWQEVGRMKRLDGMARFPTFTRLAKCVLTLPVSNADTEFLALLGKLSLNIALKWTRVPCVL